MNTYAAELDHTNTITRVIVGTAQWATEMLGGNWVDTPEKVGPGWQYVDGQIVPPGERPTVEAGDETYANLEHPTDEMLL